MKRTKKIIAAITAITLVTVLTFSALGKAPWIAFWLTAAGAYIIARYVLPKF